MTEIYEVYKHKITMKQTYFYLEEGDSIRAVASAAGDLELVIGYEEIA